jgi:hypothetical protein
MAAVANRPTSTHSSFFTETCMMEEIEWQKNQKKGFKKHKDRFTEEQGSMKPEISIKRNIFSGIFGVIKRSCPFSIFLWNQNN